MNERYDTRESWWVGVQREGWDEKVKEELPRIQTSKFARWNFTTDFSEYERRPVTKRSGSDA